MAERTDGPTGDWGSKSLSLSFFLYFFLCFLLSIYLSVCLFVCLSIHPSVHPSIRPSVYLSICLSVSLSVYLSVCLSVCLSIWLFVCLSVCLFDYLSVYLSVYLIMCLSIWLIVCLSVYLSVCLSVYASIDPSIYRWIYLPTGCLNNGIYPPVIAILIGKWVVSNVQMVSQNGMVITMTWMIWEYPHDLGNPQMGTDCFLGAVAHRPGKAAASNTASISMSPKVVTWVSTRCWVSFQSCLVDERVKFGWDENLEVWRLVTYDFFRLEFVQFCGEWFSNSRGKLRKIVEPAVYSLIFFVLGSCYNRVPLLLVY